MSLRFPRWIAAIVALLAAAIGAYYAWTTERAPKAVERYETAAVDRGNIVQMVTANGTLNPVVLVNVGTQVSGTINKLFADFNDHVKAGQVLAELDPSLLKAQLLQSQANLASAQANLILAQSNANRSRLLFQQQMVSQANLDQTAQALAAAQAQVELARAQVNRDRTNLDYTVIRSPVSGVVVARNVDVGQTVAASFQTPTLFSIAQDLRRMQIDTSVAEADIGGVREGQTVDFTVDAFPEREFQGKVYQVRLNPTIQQNVVTYDVVVSVDNKERLLMPGMTANVHIITAERRNVLRIPNSVLRYRPSSPIPTPKPAPSPGRATPADETDDKTVYRLQNGQVTPIGIRTGITDNKSTEVMSGDLKPGDLLVVEDREAKKPAGGGQFHFRAL